MGSQLFPGVRHTSSVAAPPPDDPIWSAFVDETAPPLPQSDTTHGGHACPDCATDKWVAIHEDEITCTACGIHLGYLIDSSAEYRWFGSDDRNPDPSRVGNPLNPLLPESSMGTRILVRPGDGRAMQSIRKYHLWTIMPYRERTLWSIFEMLHVRASNAGISNAIIEETKQLYAQVSPLCICRGQQKDALVAACLYESLKRHDTPRRPTEIASIFQIDVKLVTRGVKQFSGLLDEHQHNVAVAAMTASTAAAPMTITAKDATTAAAAPAVPAPPVLVRKDKLDTPSTNFTHYLEPAIFKLETPRSYHGQLIEIATALGAAIDELGICPETTPSSLAASALSIACELLSIHKPNADIARVCSISAATLQKCLKRIHEWRPVLFRQIGRTA